MRLHDSLQFIVEPISRCSVSLRLACIARKTIREVVGSDRLAPDEPDLRRSLPAVIRRVIHNMHHGVAEWLGSFDPTSRPYRNQLGEIVLRKIIDECKLSLPERLPYRAKGAGVEASAVFGRVSE